MAAPNYISGKTGYVSIGGTHYRFGKWKAAMKTALPKTTNFEGGGYQEVVAAITSATIFS